MSTTIRYAFEDIPNFTTLDIAMKAGLLDLLPHQTSTSDLLKALAETLEGLTKTSVTLTKVHQKVESSEGWEKSLSNAGLSTLLTLRNENTPVYLHVDQGSALELIARMFGGEKSDTRAAGAISAAELGVVSSVLLKLLSEAAEQSWPNLELTEMSSDRSFWRSRLMETTHVYSIDIGLGIAGRGGLARFAIPLSLLDFSALTTASWSLPADVEQLTRRYDALSHLHSEYIAIVSELELNPDEQASLKEGDIVLLDDHALAWQNDELTGTIRLRLRDRPRAEILGDLTQTATGSDAVMITSLPEYFAREDETMSDEENPVEEAPVEEHTQVANLPQTETLLREVPAPVSIELGRLQLNASEVARLKQGQILKLPRNSDDPVNLVVDNEVFAQGELVRVDGELGVRISTILDTTEDRTS